MGTRRRTEFSHFCQRRKCSLKLLADVNPPSDKRAWPYVIFFNHTKLNGLTLQDAKSIILKSKNLKIPFKLSEAEYGIFCTKKVEKQQNTK